MHLAGPPPRVSHLVSLEEWAKISILNKFLDAAAAAAGVGATL